MKGDPGETKQLGVSAHLRHSNEIRRSKVPRQNSLEDHLSGGQSNDPTDLPLRCQFRSLCSFGRAREKLTPAFPQTLSSRMPSWRNLYFCYSWWANASAPPRVGEPARSAGAAFSLGAHVSERALRVAGACGEDAAFSAPQPFHCFSWREFAFKANYKQKVCPFSPMAIYESAGKAFGSSIVWKFFGRCPVRPPELAEGFSEWPSRSAVVL